jgi:hypothetical protein
MAFAPQSNDIRQAIAPLFSNKRQDCAISSAQNHSRFNIRESDMAMNKLIWVGLLSCLAALAIQVFPEAAFRIGADVKASWLVFGFGVFLILTATLTGISGRRGDKR